MPNWTNWNARALPNKSFAYSKNRTLNLESTIPIKQALKSTVPWWHLIHWMSNTPSTCVFQQCLSLLDMPVWHVVCLFQSVLCDASLTRNSTTLTNPPTHRDSICQSSPIKNHANHPCQCTQQGIRPIASQTPAQIGFAKPQTCHVSTRKGWLEESEARWGEGRRGTVWEGER